MPNKKTTKPAQESTNSISTKDFAKRTVPKPVLGNIDSGAIGTTVPNKVASKSNKKAPAKPVAKKVTEEDKAAIYSTKNVSWEGVGKIYRGYNIVTKEDADKWLTRNHTRMATPQEVAEEFGV